MPTSLPTQTSGQPSTDDITLQDLKDAKDYSDALHAGEEEDEESETFDEEDEEFEDCMDQRELAVSFQIFDNHNQLVTATTKVIDRYGEEMKALEDRDELEQFSEAYKSGSVSI